MQNICVKIYEVFMNISKLSKATEKPAIYTKGTANMWVDPHISTQLLQTHLSQETDLASRKAETIQTTVDWILGKLPGGPLSILDLGCGPGLYAEKLAQKGHRVTGMDFSENSINHARQSAKAKGLDITYRCQNYLTLEDENTYDLVIMIFLDFCVLTPDERDVLLKKVHKSLKPGGSFIVDVLNDAHSIKGGQKKEWEISRGGFWRKMPYIALSEMFYYEAENVLLNQHAILEEDDTVSIYRFWRHVLSDDALSALMTGHGFKTPALHKNIIPGCDLYSSDEVTFCIADK